MQAAVLQASYIYIYICSSKHNMVRIYKVLNVSEESKQWVKEKHASRKPGQSGAYPPALQEIVAQRKSFDQRKRI